jgi:hypothetical protein
MVDPIVLTFAELEFLLRSCPDGRDLVLGTLHLVPEASSDVVVAAGLASLLARGLCTKDQDQFFPVPELAPVVAALSAPVAAISAVAWVGTDATLAHVFTGSSARIALYPGLRGQFAVELLDPTEGVPIVLTRFIDQYLTGDREAVVMIRSGLGDDRVSLAVAVDEAGSWHLSDSVDTPDRSVGACRDAALRRIGELFDLGRAPVYAGRG